jgi:hypothetical protein
VDASGPQQLFGHDPARDRGRIDVRDHGRLFVIDVGMSPAIDYSEGAVLLIDRGTDEEVATSLDAAGARREFWRGRASKFGGGPVSARRFI